jgi:regulation of enolase protein 1 (concanavalin A-like superfamily)
LTTRQIRGGALSAVGLVCALAVGASVVRAQSALPAGWASREIGSTGMDGSAAFSSGTWTITGGGANIWGTSDEFRFAYQQITGDVDIRVRLASLEDFQRYSKAGVMIRETLNADSRNAFILFRGDSTLFLQSRPKPGGSTARGTYFAGAVPVWLRLVRRGSEFTGYFSSNGTSWTTAGTATVSMAATAYVGLAVTSRTDSALSTATFTNLQFSDGDGPTTTTLPAPWTGRDIGSPALAGSASAAGGTFTVTAGGIDIWGTSDQFHFVYQPLQGDVEVIARVASLQYADPWSKAGVMIRETLTGASRHVSMMATGTQGWSFPRRTDPGGTSYGSPYYAGAAPGWVRLVREGNLFSGYTSTDGTTWALVEADTVAMASTVYVGVALTSHDTAQRATATFTNLTARTPTTGTNQPPTVTITGPASGATFTAPATITVTAAASDTDGAITRVDFYRGSQLIGSDTTDTYSATATSLPAGTYQLTAVATDSDGVTRTSSPVSVTVNGTTNQPPTVSLTSPAASSTFTAPASITLAATASDSDGSVTRVDFYRGSTLIGSDTSSPYSYNWTNVATGSYQLSAVARDDDGATGTSASANISVTTVPNQLPTVSITNPIAGQSFTAPASLTIAAAASDSDGTIARVDFYAGTQLVASDTASPYQAAWSNVAAGNYSLTAVARDNLGGTRTSSAVAVSITTVAPTPTRVVYTASADHATNVSSYTVAIYRGADPVTASPVATRDLGKPAPVGGDITVDISTLVNPLPAGTYKAVVRASGPGGTTASAPSPTFSK